MAALVGCAALGGSGLTPETGKAAKEEAVAARSGAYWKALIAGDYQTAYAFLSPSSRATISYERYKGQMEAAGVVRRAAAVEKVECEVAVCKVVTTLTFDHPMMQGITTRNEETWVIDSGQAWLVRKV
jgi:hypothetical protein